MTCFLVTRLYLLEGGNWSFDRCGTRSVIEAFERVEWMRAEHFKPPRKKVVFREWNEGCKCGVLI